MLFSLHSPPTHASQSSPPVVGMGSSIANASVTATPGLSSGGGGAGFYVIFGLVTGILSLTGLIQLGYSFIELYLPSTRLKALDAASNETIDLYRSMLEDGLFAHPDQARSMEHRLSKYAFTCDLRCALDLITSAQPPSGQ